MIYVCGGKKSVFEREKNMRDRWIQRKRKEEINNTTETENDGSAAFEEMVVVVFLG